MKNKSLSYLVLLMVMLIPFSIQNGRSQDVPDTASSTQSIKLSGSTLKTEDVVLRAGAIFVGSITQMGTEIYLPPTSSYAGPIYRGVKVAVLQVLKGSVSSEISVTLPISTLDHEKMHELGKSYIFFLKKKGTIGLNTTDPVIVLKLLPATDKNISKVRALIAAGAEK